MQSVTIEGYLAADPTLLTSMSSGRVRATFRILETARYRRRDGARSERTTGFNCVCFDAAKAEGYIARYARRGSRVIVTGHVENDTWTGQDGVARYDLGLVVSELRLKTRRTEPAADVGDRNAEGEGDEPPF